STSRWPSWPGRRSATPPSRARPPRSSLTCQRPARRSYPPWPTCSASANTAGRNRRPHARTQQQWPARGHCRPGELTGASGRDGAELLHHGDAVELRPDIGHPTVVEAVEVHALDSDRLAGGGDSHELLLQGTGHDPPGGDGVAAGDDVLQVLLQ